MSDWKKIVHQLDNWFIHNQRTLPWREKYDPYQIWISEIMLQQTRMDTVVNYFVKWMKEFGDIETLARASEEKVLKMWEGLGYYSRGKNILTTARLIVSEFEGKMPANRKVLESLPGIGPYTAGAIASIAFQLPEPCIDGNIQRLFSRLWDWKEAIHTKKSRDFLDRKSRKLLQIGDPRILNQAMMEIGSLICFGKKPDCAACPVSEFCHARQRNSIHLRPLKRKAASIEKQTVLYVVFHSKGRYFLQKQAEDSFWSGMWLFPFQKLATNQNPAKNLEEITHKHGLTEAPPQLTTFEHSVTRFRIRALVYYVEVSWPLFPAETGDWFTLSQLDRLALPKPGVMIRNALQQESTLVR